MKTKAPELRVLFLPWLLLASSAVWAAQPEPTSEANSGIPWPATEVYPAHSGSWYLPEEDGWGVILNVTDDFRAPGWWFTYDPDGSPVWFELDGNIMSNMVFGRILHHSGLRYLHLEEDQPSRIDDQWGQFEMVFVDCDSAVFTTWQQPPTWTGDEEPVIKNLQRLTYISGHECSSIPTIAEQIAGDWLVDMYEGAYAELISTTVDENGLFEYVDFLACTWEGQIGSYPEDHLPPLATPDYVLNIGAAWCGLGPVSYELYGTRFINYEACQQDGVCKDWAEVMYFYDPNDVSQDWWFVR
jgi:hypothetical protein